MSGEERAFGRLATPEVLDDDAIEQRAHELLAALTHEEKLGLLSGDAPFWPGLADMVNGGYADHPWVAGAVPRLGIPGLRFVDGPRGVVLDGATTFPVSMARGATFDVDLEARIGDAIGRELRALGGNFFGGVCINLLRHPAWGRAQETYGEDPHHVGELGAACTRGVQRHVMACVKHYALNSMENARFTVDVRVSERALHEVYLRHFRRVVDEGVAAVMSSYNRVNGAWAGESEHLLGRVLKERWGFRGLVMTDFVFGLRDPARALAAGMDVEMPFRMHVARALPSLLARGRVARARVDDAALRSLRQQVRFGQGRDASAYGPDVVGCAAHRALAREAAAKSIVLLRNEGSLLPLRSDAKVALIGRLASVANTGDRGSSNTRPRHVVTPLEGLRAALGDRLTYDDGADLARAAAVARAADVAICVVGYTAEHEGEYVAPGSTPGIGALFPRPQPRDLPHVLRAARGMLGSVLRGGEGPGFSRGGDRAELTLPAADEALIAAVHAANPRTVVVVEAGSAVVTEAFRSLVPALLMLWYPGQEGGHALADVLLGAVNPSGRLPCTFAASASQLPPFDRSARSVEYDLWHGYRKLEVDGATPAFPFGFGLSYTTFELSNPSLEADVVEEHGTLRVRVDVTNTGAVAGDDVVQLYVAKPDSGIERAPEELRAFARVHLAAGERRSLELSAATADLAYHDGIDAFVIEPGAYQAVVAHSAGDPGALTVPFRIRRTP